MAEARRFLIRGRVQGVGFRAFVYDQAIHEGIGGFARNRPDGSVEVVAEGEAEAMRRFETKLRTGPAAARVDEVEVDILAPGGRPPNFTIR